MRSLLDSIPQNVLPVSARTMKVIDIAAQANGIIALDDNGTRFDEVPFLAAYKPTVNDLVNVLCVGEDKLILGSSKPGSAAGGGLSQADADLRYVNVPGDTMTGDLAIVKTVGDPTFRLNSAAVDSATLEWQSGGLSRWKIYKEGSSNDRLLLNRYDDAGAYVAVVLAFVRTTGVVESRATSIGGKTLFIHDTGTRAITSGFMNGGTGRLTLRRIGNIVIAMFDPITPGSTGVFYRPPSGFAIADQVRSVVATSANSAFRVYTTGTDLTTNATTGIYGQAVWATDDAWPTSLPGVAA